MAVGAEAEFDFGGEGEVFAELEFFAKGEVDFVLEVEGCWVEGEGLDFFGDDGMGAFDLEVEVEVFVYKVDAVAGVEIEGGGGEAAGGVGVVAFAMA